MFYKFIQKHTRKYKKGGGFFSSLKTNLTSSVNAVRNVLPSEKLETNVKTLERMNAANMKDSSEKNRIQVKLNREIISKVKTVASKNELNGISS